jgi:diamine N-acetyltransferase
MENDGAVKLRRVQPSDLNQLLEWENNQAFWTVSERNQRIDAIDMIGFLEEQEGPVFELNQVRWMIQDIFSGRLIGTLDLYEIDWEQNLAYIGILIASQKDRRKGYATEAISNMERFVVKEWSISCVRARIQEGNTASMRCFRGLDYVEIEKEPKPNRLNGLKFNYLTLEKWLNE